MDSIDGVSMTENMASLRRFGGLGVRSNRLKHLYPPYNAIILQLSQIFLLRPQGWFPVEVYFSILHHEVMEHLPRLERKLKLRHFADGLQSKRIPYFGIDEVEDAADGFLSLFYLHIK